MRGLAALSVDRPVATLMVVIAIVVFGRVSLDRLPVDLLPDIAYPTVTVRSEYTGAAPEEVERDVIDPLEEVLRTVEGVIAVESVSRAGLGEVYLRFQWGTELDVVTQRVRERLALVQLREGIPPPRILRYDPALEPIFRVALRGRSDDALRSYALDELGPALEALPGVAMIRVRGGADSLILVRVDDAQLARHGLTMTRIEERLQAENISLVGGRLKDRGREVLVRTDNELRSIEELRDVVVRRDGNASIRLRDVAVIERGLDTVTTMTTWQGETSVEVDVFREADANLVAVADRLRARLFEGPTALAETMPEGIALDVSDDQSHYIRAAIREVQSNALLGALCAVLVLLVFLRAWYPTFVIALSIPLSIMATFAPLNWAGVSLNIMSLGGLALGVGMLVDNAVVVLEAIVRRQEEGESPRDAALAGSGEVTGAVIASTLTTVAVFAPIVFVEGIASLFFGDLATTVVLSLLASLIFALLFVPMLLALRGRRADPRIVQDESEPGWATLRHARRDLTFLSQRVSAGPARVLWLVALPFVALWVGVRLLLMLPLEALAKAVMVVLRGLGVGAERWRVWRNAKAAARPVRTPETTWGARAMRRYEAFIGMALRYWAVVLILVAALMGGAFFASKELGVELVPQMETGEFRLRLEYPSATPLDEMYARTRALERAILELEAVRTTAAMVGDDARANQTEAGARNVAWIRVQLASSTQGAVQQKAVIDAIRAQLDRAAGVVWSVEESALIGSAAPIRIEIVGDDLDVLRQTAVRVEALLQATDGVVDVRNFQVRGGDELVIRLKRDRLAAYGLSAQEVAEGVRSMTRGQRATVLRVDNERLDVEIRNDGLTSIDALRALQIPLPTQAFGVARGTGDTPSIGGMDLQDVLRSSAGQSESTRSAVRLDALADFDAVAGPAEIRHIRARRTAVVEAGAGVRDLGSVTDELRQRLADEDFDERAYVRLAGQSDDIDTARNSLFFAFGLAIFLVYAVMASLFESFIGPLLIMVSVPLALAAVVIGLAWAGFPVSILVLIGGIVLVGIVVNNAIVLVDAMLQLERAGVARDVAVVQASRTRLRPVLITATTTVLGLLPMLISTGEGAEIRRPLAFVLVVGLTAATVLTLVVIPVFYRLFMPAPKPA